MAGPVGAKTKKLSPSSGEAKRLTAAFWAAVLRRSLERAQPGADPA